VRLNIKLEESISIINRHLGVGISPKDAEKVRLRLKNSKLLISGLKPLKVGNLIFFPIGRNNSISDLLYDVFFQIQKQEFPKRQIQNSLVDFLKLELPNERWDEISLKYDQCGEIAILKLDPLKTSLPIRRKVGKAILMQNQRIKTVLNKSDIISGSKRVFPIEVLAGERKYQTWHKEYGINIYVDFKKAYFNPRLAEEHHRVAISVQSSDKILDLFTGVGPFALHCAKQTKCTVIAVDVNFEAIDALRRSINRNKLQGEISSIVGDSRKVINSRHYFDRVIINLPQKSVDFLSYAAKLVKKGGIITFYQFIPQSEDPKKQIRQLIRERLEQVNSYKEIFIQVGREVSPSRVQMNIDLQMC